LAFEKSPNLIAVRVEARGGTVDTRHAVTINNEVLGSSDGTPGQSFRLLNAPLLALDPEHDHLIVTTAAANGVTQAETWEHVDDFGASGPHDRHFTLDSLDGTLTLGPALMQPDRTVYQFGAVPPKNARLHFTRYRHGGGVIGNVPPSSLTILKRAVPYVTRVTNHGQAAGGLDAQTLDDARLRAPRELRTRDRAVTADDYAHLALKVEGVRRAHCLAPGAQPQRGGGRPRPGEVTVLVLPEPHALREPPAGAPIELDGALHSNVVHYLDARRLLGTQLEVRGPLIVPVSIEVSMSVSVSSDPGRLERIRLAAEQTLYRFLDPYTGGESGQGWPFGRQLHRSELYSLLHRLPGVQSIDQVRIVVHGQPADLACLTLPDDAVLRSNRHQVTIQ
jgi:predicted phage baseplate assembly protein